MIRYHPPLRPPAPGPVRAENPPSASPRPAVPAIQATIPSLTSVQKVLAGLMIVLLFMLYSRLPETIAIYVGSQANLFRALAAVAVLGTILTGGWRRVLSSRVNTFLVLLTLWLIVSAPFGVWPGGSAKLLIDGWSKCYLFSAASIGLLLTTRHCRSALYAFGFASMFVAVQSFFVGQEKAGRLELEAGSLGNPNDLGFCLITGIPACLLMARSPSALVRLIGKAGALLLALTAFKTGSRMGVIMMLALVLVLIIRTSGIGRLKLILAVAVTVAIMLPFLSRGVVDRYYTLFTDPPEEGAVVSEETAMAEGSTLSRIELIKLGIDITLAHPLLGVGPGMFGVATSNDPEAVKKRLAWRETHNTYLQLSSEAGLPALAFFLALLTWTLFTSFSLSRSLRRRPATQPIADMAECLFLTLTLFSVGAFFGNLAYLFRFPVWAGCTAALAQDIQLETRTLS
jgi:O-antigen ligase